MEGLILAGLIFIIAIVVFIVTHGAKRAAGETTLAEIYSLIKEQKDGKENVLHTDGRENIFRIRDAQGVLRVVFVERDNNGWSIMIKNL
jgi:hypothetical protein